MLWIHYLPFLLAVTVKALQPRAAMDNIVSIDNANSYWYGFFMHSRSNTNILPSMIMPRYLFLYPAKSSFLNSLCSEAHTNIGDSERPGGTKTYCSAAAKHSSKQGELPPDFWSNVELKKGKGRAGQNYAQCQFCLHRRVWPTSHNMLSNRMHPPTHRRPTER
jgi:hypothetical protein